MITDKRLFEHIRHHLFNHLRWWAVRMHDAYKDQNPRLIEYYEGVIWGTLDTMHVSGFISLNTYEILDNMLTSKRNKLRGEYKC
jgi:hypothetical protein